MKITLYRGTRNITPVQAQEVYIAQDSSYLYGKGMYFSYTKDKDSGIIYTRYDNSWALLTKYNVELNNVLKKENGRFVIEPDSNLAKLEKMVLALEEKLNEIHLALNYKTIQHIPNYHNLPADEQNLVFEDIMNYNEKINNSEEGQNLNKKRVDVLKLKHDIELLYESEFEKFDAIMVDNMVVIKKQEVKIEVESFDLLAKKETLEKIYNTIKVGELGDMLENIPGEYAEIVSKMLKEQE